MTNEQNTICIIGGGLVGMSAALFLSQNGLPVVLCAAGTNTSDERTTALLSDTVLFFKKLGVWELIAEKAFPLKTMRLVDGTNRLLRAPQTDFLASEIDLEAFGYNIKNHILSDALGALLERQESLRKIKGAVERINKHDGGYEIEIKTAGKSVSIDAGFIVGADGRNSIVRETFELGERKWNYQQSALVVDFKHEHSSHFTSTEFHTETGPFTIVPHSNHSAGLVWMEVPEEVERMAKLPISELANLIETKMQSFLGKIEISSKVQYFPISGMTAMRFGKNNCALIGEAAHVFPPIGAQGFNLGVRDVEALGKVLSDTPDWNNIGDAYHAARVTDIGSRTLGVDLLNRSLLSDFLPIQLLRGLGLYALGNIAPLRKQIMKMGISPETRITG